MAKHIRRFDTQADFESVYFDEDIYEICGIGITIPQWDDQGTYTGDQVVCFMFVDEEGGNMKAKPATAPYAWNNGSNTYYTKKRYPDIEGA